MSHFTQAIVRAVPRTLERGLTTAQLGAPDYDRACEQHARYVEALRRCGLSVIQLAADGRFPDSPFVEDTAVVTARCAVIAHPGAPSRRGETAAVEEVLRGIFNTVEHIASPGTLDGGDVLQVGPQFFIGLSARTNRAGAEQLAQILRDHDYTATLVPLRQFLHLKTGVSYLGAKDLLVAGELADSPYFRRFSRLLVPSEEAYCANAVRVNDEVLFAEGYPQTRECLKAMRYSVIELAVDEFRKVDGGLSCLSLRIP